VERLLPLPPYTLAFTWFGLTAAAGVGSSLIGRRHQGRPGAEAIGNKVERTVWGWAGAFLTTIAVALFVRAALGGGNEAWALFQIMSPVGFGAYAVALGTTAIASGDRGVLPYAFLSLAFAAATTILIGSPHQFLVAAAGVLLVMILCGARHLRLARQGG
jgi:hypothetical protein